jgi:hypothetical protein
MEGASNIHVFKKKIGSGIEIPTANIANAAATKRFQQIGM